MDLSEDKAYELLQKTKAPWQEDGFGIRGDLKQQQTNSATAGTFLPSVVHRNPDTITRRSVSDSASTPPDLATPAVPPSTTPPNVYTFEMFNASDKNGHKVLILDGTVYGPFDDGNTPQGMGNDNFTIDINDGDDAYLVIPIADNRAVVPPITIATGPTTPDDTDTTLYVTIGNFSIDKNIVTVENTLCGDYTIPNTLDVLDEDSNVFSDIQSVQFTTDGDPYIDVTVVEDAPGEVSVHINSSPDLVNLLTQLENIIANLIDCNDS
jgi:hypothetical protein